MDIETGLAIIAPPEVQAVAVPLFKRYTIDELIHAPPLITLTFPFVPYADLDQACATLRTICAGIAPFDVILQGYGQFPGVAFMNPANPAPIQNLYRAIYARFPDYPPFEGRYGTELHPHLSVAFFASEAEQQAAHLPAYDPITFRVERIHVLYGAARPAGLPYITYDVIPLGC
ncbi:MAG: 2'-5' RNA ligase family protein [Anaerolineae bacterium]|nr:2'-5' RNA ligase family protein [Anaerolineae bacterium]